MANQRIKANLIPSCDIYPVIHLAQYDVSDGTWKQVEIELYYGTDKFTIPSGASITFRGTKRDKTGYSYEITKFTDNVVTVDVKPQMTVLSGTHFAELRISKGNTISNTIKFVMKIDSSALADDTKVSETDLSVIEKALQASDAAIQAKAEVEQLKESVEASEKNAKQSETNASQSATNAQESAESASSSATTASTKATEASTSATKAKESETNASQSATNAQSSAESAIQTKAEVEQLKKETVEQTKTLTDSAKQEISTVKDATVTEVTELKNSTVSEITSLKDSTIEAVTLLKDNAKAEADRATESSTSAKAQAEKAKASADSIANVTSDVEKLKEDLPNKITKFYASNQGETHITDSDNGKIQDMMVYGKSSQDGTPSVENPVEIKSVVNPTIKLLGSNILKIADGEYQDGGVTATVSNGVVKLKGTANRYLDILLTANNKFVFKEGTKVIFSPNNVKGIENKDDSYLDFTNNNTIGFSIMSNNLNTPYIIKEKDTKYPFLLFIRCHEGKTYDETWTPQVLIGETITPFKPYTEQTITLPITLNAVPVSSGGNVTINGQQYIADRVVEKDGVFGIERNIREIHTNTKTMNNSEMYPGWNKVEDISDTIYYNEALIGQSRRLYSASNFTNRNIFQNNVSTYNILYYIQNDIGYSQSELIAKAIDADIYIRLQNAIFEPLPVDIQVKLQTFVTNYPVTNISVTSDQLDGYTVFNYPISLANGWNYVKQQLNDNRDYIYDMDLQSAEAYVNSEYAVTLTELEV